MRSGGTCPVCGKKLDYNKSLAAPTDYDCCCKFAESEDDLIRVFDDTLSPEEFVVPNCGDCPEPFKACISKYIMVHPQCRFLLWLPKTP